MTLNIITSNRSIPLATATGWFEAFDVARSPARSFFFVSARTTGEEVAREGNGEEDETVISEGKFVR